MTKIYSFLKNFMASIAILFTVVGGFFVSTIPTLAQSNSGPALPSFSKNVLGGFENVRGDSQGITNIVVGFANWLIFILAAIAVLFIVYGGFLYVTDDGSETGAGKGKKIVINALIGLIVAIISFTLVSVVANITKTTNINTGGGGINTIILK